MVCGVFFCASAQQQPAQMALILKLPTANMADIFKDRSPPVTPEMVLMFVPACFALNMAPGPNNLLSVSYASRFGFTVACLAGLGRLLAFIGMIAVTATGLAVVLQTSPIAFTVIKVGGALYLLYLALQLWHAPVPATSAGLQPPPASSANLWRLARQEFIIALGNPKAIVIFTAFLPQFVNPAQPAPQQFALLGLLFLILEWGAIAAYAFIGFRLGRWFAVPARRRRFNRVCASLLSLAAVGLILSK